MTEIISLKPTRSPPPRQTFDLTAVNASVISNTRMGSSVLTLVKKKTKQNKEYSTNHFPNASPLPYPPHPPGSRFTTLSWHAPSHPYNSSLPLNTEITSHTVWFLCLLITENIFTKIIQKYNVRVTH